MLDTISVENIVVALLAGLTLTGGVVVLWYGCGLYDRVDQLILGNKIEHSIATPCDIDWVESGCVQPQSDSVIISDTRYASYGGMLL